MKHLDGNLEEEILQEISEAKKNGTCNILVAIPLISYDFAVDIVLGIENIHWSFDWEPQEGVEDNYCTLSVWWEN